MTFPRCLPTTAKKNHGQADFVYVARNSVATARSPSQLHLAAGWLSTNPFNCFSLEEGVKSAKPAVISMVWERGKEPKGWRRKEIRTWSFPEEVWQVVTQPGSQQQHQDQRLSDTFLDKKDWTRNELHECNQLGKKLHQSPNLVPSKQQVHTGDLCGKSLMCNLDFTPNAYLARRRFECDGGGNLSSIRNLKLHLQERMHADVTSVEVF
nr:LOW QUALITY PROTEIN: putative protein ZNF815 [Chlorocebus sabaeus]